MREGGVAPLRTLARFAGNYLTGVVSGIHILPFYPYSSDDGFSVLDYHAVDPALGTWEDVAAVGRRFRLMFDAVINHISAGSQWVLRFQAGEAPYRDFFTVVDPAADLSAVFRPRTLPLLTPLETAGGQRHVWTTFSADQIDLNYHSPDLLMAVVDVLLDYVARGADLLRLDAIAFMWKEIGTSCIHLPQTHAIIQLLRAVLDEVAPHVALITETNVPHEENISYFGDGTNEAQLVYNFSLPPLVLHAFHGGDATVLTRWAQSLVLPGDRVTFFNFLASHDGIGVTPARGLLPPGAIAALADRVAALGGHVSYRSQPDGSQIAYELNINYMDALADPAQPDEPLAKAVARMAAAHAIMFALRGVPGIYFHSLFGSANWPAGVAQTGRLRTINREKLAADALDAALADSATRRSRVFGALRHLLQVRRREPAFHPGAPQRVHALAPAVFAVERGPAGAADRVLTLANVSTAAQVVRRPEGWAGDLIDVVANRPVPAGPSLTLAPYQVAWLKQV